MVPTSVLTGVAPVPKLRLQLQIIENKANYNRRNSYALSEKLGQKLLKTGCFQIADRNRMQEIMQEHGLGQSGFVRRGSAARFGKLLGVDLLVFGTVTQYSLNAPRNRNSRIEETARIEWADGQLCALSLSTPVVFDTVFEVLAKLEVSGVLGFATTEWLDHGTR